MTSMRWLWFLPITLKCIRVTDADVAFGRSTVSRERIQGKVVRCTVGKNVVFDKVEEESVFPASFEYSVGEGAGEPGWVIDIPGVLHLEVDSEKMMVARLGFPFQPTSYTVFLPSEAVDPSGADMQKSLQSDSGNWIEQFAIVRVSGTLIRLTAFMRKQSKFPADQKNVEIEFTGAGPVPALVKPRQNLPALEYCMPMEGKIIRLNVDGKTVFDQGSSKLEFPVVGTPTATGLTVNVVGFTKFDASKNEMEKKNHFTPNNHGFTTVSDDQNALIHKMFGGFLRWHHTTTLEGIDISPELTIKSNENSVAISGNGTELIFSKEPVEWKVTKCTAGDAVVFEQAEKDSVFKANWKYNVDDGPGNLLTGWVIDIPGIVRFNINMDSLIASGGNSFLVSHYTYFTTEIDETGNAMKNMFSNTWVEKVSITWDSQTMITFHAQTTNGNMIDIEFTRVPTAAIAGDVDMA